MPVRADGRRLLRVCPGVSTADGPLASPLEHLAPTEPHLQYPNCSRTMRSSRLCPGSNSICMEML
jgi:hypothetical protein